MVWGLALPYLVPQTVPPTSLSSSHTSIANILIIPLLAAHFCQIAVMPPLPAPFPAGDFGNQACMAFSATAPGIFLGLRPENNYLAEYMSKCGVGPGCAALCFKVDG